MPVRGSVRLVPVSTSPLHICLTRYTRNGVALNHEWIVHPRGKKVRFQAKIPDTVFLGDDLVIAFKTKRATSVVVEINDEPPRICRPNDVIVLRPEKPGTELFRFNVKSPHGDATIANAVQVVARKPLIDLSATSKAVRPGTDAIFSWTIRFADAAWLEGRGERHAIALHDAVAVPVGRDEEELQLVAVGIGGTTRCAFRVTPWLLGDI
jgi:hypothetical protein